MVRWMWEENVSGQMRCPRPLSCWCVRLHPPLSRRPCAHLLHPLVTATERACLPAVCRFDTFTALAFSFPSTRCSLSSLTLSAALATSRFHRPLLSMSDLPYKSWKNTPLDPTPPPPGSAASKLPPPTTAPFYRVFQLALVRNRVLAEVMLASALLGAGVAWWRQRVANQSVADSNSARSERRSDVDEKRAAADALSAGQSDAREAMKGDTHAYRQNSAHDS